MRTRKIDLKDELGSHASLLPLPVFNILACRALRIESRHLVVEIRPCWRFYWNAEPGGQIEHRGETYDLSPNDFMVVAPNTQIRHVLQTPHQHFFIHAMLGSPYDSIENRIFHVPMEDPMKELAESIGRNVDVPTYEGLPTHTNVQRMDLQRNFMVVALLSHALARVPREDWESCPSDPRIVKTLDLIERAKGRILSNAELAKATSLTRNSFVRLFREQVGVPPGRYQKHRNLERVCHLLSLGDRSIDQIAEECGYCDRFHLSRQFKALYHITPVAYRKAIQNGNTKK